MPYKEWSVGEEVLATDFNVNLCVQVVPVFDSPAQRTAGLVAPVVGQLSYLKSAPGALYYWSGSAWLVLSGSATRDGQTVFTTSGTGSGTITWAGAVPGVVNLTDAVVHLTNMDNATGPLVLAASAVTSTSLTIQVWKDGAPHINSSVRVGFSVGPKTA